MDGLTEVYPQQDVVLQSVLKQLNRRLNSCAIIEFDSPLHRVCSVV